jgi:hypothetical protein
MATNLRINLKPTLSHIAFISLLQIFSVNNYFVFKNIISLTSAAVFSSLCSHVVVTVVHFFAESMCCHCVYCWCLWMMHSVSLCTMHRVVLHYDAKQSCTCISTMSFHMFMLFSTAISTTRAYLFLLVDAS